ncbi:MAG: hypothetical protein GY913_19570 [Proteobacteria bacterium]|nr:hypothetical protein [Pseudomonadota bacterium]MCP4919110.1 hypothetical protein [Pseudomonadota bacterium]
MGFFGIWPVACILVGLTGCYFGPIEGIPSNTPPEIVSFNVEPDTVLSIENDSQKVVVHATDDDETTLQALWFLSRDGEIRDARTSFDPFRTEITLSRDPDLDGQRLEVIVTDGFFQTSASWQLEVVQ